jgi:mediator of RNA polymerase II transcription subunit 16
MEEIYNEENLDHVSSLHQVGFSFADPSPCKISTTCRLLLPLSATNEVLGLESIFSPTGCSLLQVVPDGSLKWKPLRHSQGVVEETSQDGRDNSFFAGFSMVCITDKSVALYSAVIAGLTIATGAAIFYNTNFDDVLAVARPLIDKKRVLTLVCF